MEIQRFQILDGWRGICALLVAAYHLNAYSHVYEWPFLRNGYLFVDFFFVLSGFVITHAYMTRLSNWTETRIFIIRRFGRLWPLHVSILLVLIALEAMKAAFIQFGASADQAAFTRDHSVASIFTNVLLVHAMGFHQGMTWNPPSWSISTEFWAYIVFALVFTSVRSRAASLATALLIVCLSGATIFLMAKQGVTPFYYAFFKTLYGFFVGHLTYRLWQARPLGTALRNFGILEVVATAATIVFISRFPLTGGETVWNYSAPVVFAFVVWVFAHECGPISRLMNRRVVAVLGERSYSIYMVHAAILVLASRVVDMAQKRAGVPFKSEMSFAWTADPVTMYSFGGPWAMDALAILYLLSVVIVAGVSYNFVEVPGRRFFNMLAYRKLRVRIANQPAAAGEGKAPDVAPALATGSAAGGTSSFPMGDAIAVAASLATEDQPSVAASLATEDQPSVAASFPTAGAAEPGAP